MDRSQDAPVAISQNIRTNPLEIYEIVAQVGRFVRLWQEDGSRFDPGRLLSLTSVSKTWHAALLPVLWQIYDGNCMARIPNHIISKNSHHFRTIIDCKHHGPFHCAALRELNTIYNSAFTHNLIQQHQHQPCQQQKHHSLQPLLSLSILRWRGAEYPRAPIQLDLSEAFTGYWEERRAMKLSSMPTAITELELFQWSVADMRQFVHFLARYPNLATLVLSRVVNVDRAFQYRPFSDGSSSAPSSDSIPSLGTVKSLFFSSSTEMGAAFLTILDCCPNVQKVHIDDFRLSHVQRHRMSHLRSCPQLWSISVGLHSSHGASLGGPGQTIANDDDLANLFNLAEHHGRGTLEDFRGRLVYFGERSGQALARQAESFRTFDLHMQRHHLIPDSDTDELERENHRLMLAGVEDVLANCRRLTTFRLAFEYLELQEDDQHHMLFRKPWACLETLEELCLPNVGSLHMLERDAEDQMVEDEHGVVWMWCATRKTRLDVSLERQIFVLIRSMPRLKRLSLKGVVYRKVKKTRRRLSG
ncbi:hypothetical protein EDD11_004144 [Mortierella claussenii]|nr:hypothetical protein EDD11_004144 [Mortierella claussenii]